ncbi:spectrin beta chain [Anaeramoeba flamelloides]|uniref:Spectrin beta chain n=1 Tax=Anaeramoeba flamelloides TaxID=1746091 RepID=A0AAV7YEK7_9EUKA|nr:spectrin beta chain [Anaeramoeba flamelloides]
MDLLANDEKSLSEIMFKIRLVSGLDIQYIDVNAKVTELKQKYLFNTRFKIHFEKKDVIDLRIERIHIDTLKTKKIQRNEIKEKSGSSNNVLNNNNNNRDNNNNDNDNNNNNNNDSSTNNNGKTNSNHSTNESEFNNNYKGDTVNNKKNNNTSTAFGYLNKNKKNMNEQFMLKIYFEDCTFRLFKINKNYDAFECNNIICQRLGINRHISAYGLFLRKEITNGQIKYRVLENNENIFQLINSFYYNPDNSKLIFRSNGLSAPKKPWKSKYNETITNNTNNSKKAMSSSQYPFYGDIEGVVEKLEGGVWKAMYLIIQESRGFFYPDPEIQPIPDIIQTFDLLNAKVKKLSLPKNLTNGRKFLFSVELITSDSHLNGEKKNEGGNEKVLLIFNAFQKKNLGKWIKIIKDCSIKIKGKKNRKETFDIQLAAYHRNLQTTIITRIKSYCQWINWKLDDQFAVRKFQRDLIDGTIFAKIIEKIIDEQAIGIKKRPTTDEHRLYNLKIIFQLLADRGVNLPFASVNNVLEGHLWVLMEICWQLIYNLERPTLSRKQLLEWVNGFLKNFDRVPIIDNFLSLADGFGFNCILWSLNNSLEKPEQIHHLESRQQLKIAFKNAKNAFNVPLILDHFDKLDERSIMMFLLVLKRQYEKK